MEIKLDNKNALVGGSTQGIGKAIAVQMAKSGANVTLVARNEDSLRTVCNELDTSRGQRHAYIIADFSKPTELKTSISGFLKQASPIHILVNNTGGPSGGALTEASTEAFLKTFEQHLICNQILVQAVLTGMKNERYGRIINIISTSVKQPIRGLGVSNTIRGAVANWSKTLSVEVAPFGITVNNLLPGATKTQRLTSLVANKAKQSGRSEEDILKEMIEEIPAARLGLAEDLAYAAVFLASPFASYINGINIPVDGGRTGCL
ncbi:SDR family oxidoreductase [bacterium]|nr:SDR family oxidoreductase [bacterium]